MFLSVLAIGLVGILLGMLGGGGSVLILPLLVYLVGIEPVMATSYSLVIVGTAALFGSIDYMRKGLVDSRSVATFGSASVIGVFITRSVLMPSIPDVLIASGNIRLTKSTLVMTVFAFMILASAISMIFRSRRDKEVNGQSASVWISILVGCLLGLMTGFVGAGGGFMIVPALIFLLRLPIRQAIGTSLFIIAIKSLLGFAADVMVIEGIQWALLAQFIVVAVVGIMIGVRLNQKVPAEKLKVGFGWTVLGVGIAILIREFS